MASNNRLCSYPSQSGVQVISSVRLAVKNCNMRQVPDQRCLGTHLTTLDTSKLKDPGDDVPALTEETEIHLLRFSPRLPQVARVTPPHAPSGAAAGSFLSFL